MTHDLKAVCILFRAQKIAHDGMSYTVPASWKALYVAPKVKLWSDRFKLHVPFLTAIKKQQLFLGMEGEG